MFYSGRRQYVIRNGPIYSSANISKYIVPGTTSTVQQYLLGLTTLSNDKTGQPAPNPIIKINEGLGMKTTILETNAQHILA